MAENPIKSFPAKKYLALLSPYLAVFVGLYYFQNAWAAIGIYYAGITAVILLNDPVSLFRQILRGFQIRWAAAYALICLCICPLIIFFWPMAKLPSVEIKSLLQTYGLQNTVAVLFSIVAIIINPLLEEGFWRGLFSADPRRPALIDILFAAYHLFVLILAIDIFFAILGTLGLAGFSWAMRAIRAHLGGLSVLVLAHLAADISIILAIYLLLRKTG